MFHRELTASDLNDAVLLDLLRMEDPLGVLSVFAALSGPELISLAMPMPLASRVVLDSRPFVRPLLELLDEGEPAGVVLTSTREAEVLDWRLGALRRLTRGTREPEEEHGQSTTPHDQRARRERDRQMRWIALPAPGIPVDNPPGWSEARWPVPGSLLALTASYVYGAHLERGAGEDDR